jgi:hypothetical protein
MNVATGSKVDLGTNVVVKGKASAKNIASGERSDMIYDLVNVRSGAVLATQRTNGILFGAFGIGEDTTGKTFKLSESGHFKLRLFVKYEGGKDASGNASGSCIKDIYVNTPPPPPEKEIACTNLISSFGRGQRITLGEEVSVRGQATGRNLSAGQTVDMHYDYTDQSGKIIDTKKAAKVKFDGEIVEDQVSRTFKPDKPGTYTFRVAIKYDGSKEAVGSRGGDCAKEVVVQEPCLEEENSNETECLILSKTAKNDTQNIENADGTVAEAGDTIIYTLSTKNTSKGTEIKDYVVEENLIDVMQYADIVNLGGGKLDDYGVARWPATNIKSGETLSKKITIKIKNPIPSTPISTSDPGSYDMKLTNIYGNTVNVKLPPNIVKTTEYVTTELPNTGPGETIAAGFVILTGSGYFFMRSRLLAKEADLIKEEFAIAGGV